MLGIQAHGAVVAVRAMFEWLHSDAAVFAGEGFLAGNEGSHDAIEEIGAIEDVLKDDRSRVRR